MPTKTPLFQARHYKSIAKAIAEDTWSHQPSPIIDVLVKLFQDDNPKFDRTRFLSAIRGDASMRLR